jgi:hypothetical protein
MPLSHEELVELMERDLASSEVHPFPAGTTLYHYTDAPGLLGVLRERKIRATHYRYLNDSDELLRGERIVQDMAETMAQEPSISPLHKDVLDSFARTHRERSLTKIADVFVASFSEHGNQLSQWRGYAANGNGYSVGFSGLRLAKGDQPDAVLALELVQCEYDEQQFRAAVRARFDKILSTLDRHALAHGAGSRRSLAGSAVAHILRSVAAVIPRLKHSAFHEEREWRLMAIPILNREKDVIQFRASVHGVVPYIAIDLCETSERLQLARVYVGPTQEPERGQASTEMLLTNLGYDGEALVRLSEIPFRG